VVVSSSRERLLASSEAARRTRRVIWHDVECGVYRADLPLWRELAGVAEAQAGPAPILEIGAGTGRVALDLSRAGHRVTALDVDPEFLLALRERAGEAKVETVRADARSFELARRDFALCIVPMQTVQLLGGAGERVAFLRRARAHLRPGAVLACAIVTDLESFDCAAGDAGPSAELARFDGELYASRPTRVSVRMESIEIERERRILAAGAGAGEAPLAGELDVIELARVDPFELEHEGRQAGLTATPRRTIAPTEEHVGSAVVMLRA
jgi:SAM-dependent methyltransferase